MAKRLSQLDSRRGFPKLYDSVINRFNSNLSDDEEKEEEQEDGDISSDNLVEDFSDSSEGEPPAKKKKNINKNEGKKKRNVKSDIAQRVEKELQAEILKKHKETMLDSDTNLRFGAESGSRSSSNVITNEGNSSCSSNCISRKTYDELLKSSKQLIRENEVLDMENKKLKRTIVEKEEEIYDLNNKNEDLQRQVSRQPDKTGKPTFFQEGLSPPRVTPPRMSPPRMFSRTDVTKSPAKQNYRVSL